IAGDQLSDARRLLLSSANIMRQMIACFQVVRARRRYPARSANQWPVGLDLAVLFHLVDGDVGQFLVDAKSFPQRARRNAKSQWRLNLVLCDDSSNGCHYLFDSNRCKKVVRSLVSAALLDKTFNLGG